MPTLTLKLKNKSLGEFKLQSGASLSIGRRDNNDVVIDDPAVSGHHAKIDALGSKFVLIDLKSKNGSFVNDQLINSHWLKKGDVISIGEHSLVFNYEKAEMTPESDSAELDPTIVMSSTEHRRRMIKSNPSKSINVVRFWDASQNRSKVREEKPRVTASYEGDKKGPSGALSYMAGGTGTVKLTRDITTIGKHPSSDIVVKGFLIDPTSVTIKKRPDGFYLDYLGGLPKPKINDKTVRQSTILNDLDIIDIGSIKLQFSSANPDK